MDETPFELKRYFLARRLSKKKYQHFIKNHMKYPFSRDFRFVCAPVIDPEFPENRESFIREYTSSLLTLAAQLMQFDRYHFEDKRHAEEWICFLTRLQKAKDFKCMYEAGDLIESIKFYYNCQLLRKQ